jgi:hypothetical protein
MKQMSDISDVGAERVKGLFSNYFSYCFFFADFIILESSHPITP